MRKPDFCICENKDADQLLCFRYTDSIIPLLPKSAKLISVFVFATRIVNSLYFLNPKPSSVIVQPGLCRTWSETPKTGFLTSRLKSCHSWSMFVFFFFVFFFFFFFFFKLPLKNYVNTPIKNTMKMTIQMKKDMFFFCYYFC